MGSTNSSLLVQVTNGQLDGKAHTSTPLLQHHLGLLTAVGWAVPCTCAREQGRLRAQQLSATNRSPESPVVVTRQVWGQAGPVRVKASTACLQCDSGSTISSLLLKALQNYPILSHHRQTPSEIVKCTNKDDDKRSNWVFVNFSQLA